jgi:hypothetical protein
VWRLQKAIYGLKQSAKVWNTQIDAYLRSLNFSRSLADPCIYVRKGKRGEVCAIIALYVDDLLLACASAKVMGAVKLELTTRYRMVDQGRIAWYLGMGVDYEVHRGVLKMSQTAYVKALLHRFGVEDSADKATPMVLPCPTGDDRPAEGSAEQRKASEFDYRGAIGSLLFISLCTRPDIALAVSKLSRHVANPGELHIKAVKRVLRYLGATASMALTYRRTSQELLLHGYVDASYGDEDHEQRKSTTGFVFYLGECLVSWASVRQRTVARSSTEAEIIAASDAVLEALWLRKLGYDLRSGVVRAILLRGDNTTAVRNATRGEYRRTKYIDIRIQHTLEKIRDGSITFEAVESEENSADAMTKPLVGKLFYKHRRSYHLL